MGKVSLVFFTMLIYCSSLFGQQDTYYEFVENLGQWPPQVSARAELEIGSVYFEADRLTFNLVDLSEIAALHGSANFLELIAQNPTVRGHAFQQVFIGSNTTQPVFSNKQKSHYNFFNGNDPSRWAGKCVAYGQITYPEFYEGVDLVVYSNDFFLKYDFVVKPSHSAESIKWHYVGADSIGLLNNRLIVENSVEDLIEQKPVCWQIIDGKKRLVSCQYTLLNDTISFSFPDDYDNSVELIIDPELVFSTYSGSQADNFGYTATYDADGFLYSGSSAFGNGYPTTLGAYQDQWAGGDGQGSLVGTDIVISKYDTTGTFMVYSTYLGGANDELPHSLIVDDDNQLIVLGTSSSPNFPVTDSAYDTSFGGGASFAPSGVGVNYVNGSDIIVSKFNADGNDLIGSTFLGGTGNDGLNTAAPLKFNYADEMRGEVEFDPATGDIFVVSCTYSSDFPSDNGFQTALAGQLDGCLARFTPDLSSLVWSTYMGGTSHDASFAMAINSSGNLVVCGGTASSNFPVGSGGYETQNQGGEADGFVLHIDAVNPQILNGTYFGSIWYDQLYFVELDDTDQVYVYGQTQAEGEFFIQNASYGQGDSGMLVAKLNDTLDDLEWSTTFGTGSGKPNLSPTAFLVDICGKVYMSGWGGTTNVNSNPDTDLVTGLETTDDAYQQTTNASDFYLLVLDNAASGIVYGSFFGGGSSAEHVDGGTSRFDKQGVIYQSVCAGCGGNSDFPIYPANAVSPTNNSPNCNNGVFKYKFELPPVLAAFEAPPLACIDEAIQFLNNSVSATEFEWDFGDDSPISDASNPLHSYTEPGFYDVELVAISPICGFTDTITQSIEITGFSPDLITATATPSFIAEGESSQLNALPDGLDYSWSPSGTLNNANIQDPLATPPVSTTYIVTITDGPCTYIDSVRVMVDEIVCDNTSIYVPNAFSPNGDDENDILFVRASSITDLYFTIYDRWGEQVFETTNINVGWDGMYKDKLVDPAVFVYYLEATCGDGQQHFEKGNITVIR